MLGRVRAAQKKTLHVAGGGAEARSASRIWDGKLGKGPLRTGKGRVGTWKSRNLGIFRSGDLEIEKCGIQKNKTKTKTNIQIHSAQNVGKVWISRKHILLAPFGAIPGHVFHGTKKSKTCSKFAYFPWWAHGPYSPGLGPVTNLPLYPLHLVNSEDSPSQVFLPRVH